MFSDNKKLIGLNPMYDNLVKSMDGFDYHSNNSCRSGFVNPESLNMMRRAVDSDLSDKDNYMTLYKIMNMMSVSFNLPSQVYLTNAEAVDRHKCMMFNNVFTKDQWEKAFSVTDVFDFNDIWCHMRDLIYIHAGYYIDCYGYLIVEELKTGNLSIDFLIDKNIHNWESSALQFKNNNPEMYDNPKLPYYFSTIGYIGAEMLEVYETWKESLPTLVTRMIKFICSNSDSINNPYFKQEYVF